MKRKKFLRMSCLFGALLSTQGGGVTAYADLPSEIQADSPSLYFRFNEVVPLVQTPIATNIGSLKGAATGLYEGSLTAGVTPGALVGDATDKAVSFTGGDVSVPYNSALNPSTAFTVECWANPSANSGSQYPLSPFSALYSANSGTPRQGWVIYQNLDQWQFRLGDESGYIAQVSGANAPVGQWQHIVGVYDGTSASLYVNGVLVGGPITQSRPINPNPSNPTQIGTAGDFGRAFAGLVDEAAIYGSALSPATILAHYQNGTNSARAQSYQDLVQASNPLGYWRLDELTAAYPVATNSGSLGTLANGVYLPGTLTVDGPRPSTFPGLEAANNAVGLNGSNAMVRIPATGTIAAPSLTNVTEATFMCWVKRNGAQGGYKGLFAMRPLSDGLYLNNDDTLNYSWNDASDTWGFNSGLVPPDGEWTLAAVVIRPSNVVFYMQSISGGFATANNAVTHAAGDLTTGVFAAGDDVGISGRFFNGSIDEATLFTKALPEGRFRTYFLTAVGDTHAPAFVSDVPVVSPSGTIYATTTFTLSIDAYGAGPLTYKWLKDGTQVGTSANFVKANASAADNGNYQVIVGNAYGSITSSVAAITINSAVPPTVDQAPVGRSIFAGGAVSFSVSASGTTPMTYQWKLGGVNIAGATNQTLTLTNVTAASAGTYTVGISNVAGGIVSPGAVLTVPTLVAGSYVEAVVTNGPLNYWRLDETSGTKAFDSMGRLDGTYTNGVTLGVPGGVPFGGADTAVEFDGAGGAIVLGGSAVTPPWTAILWIKRPDPVVASSAILNDSVYSIRLEQWQNTGQAGFTHYGVADYTFNYGTPTDKWVQLVFVGTTNNTTLYANGIQVDSSPNSINLPRQSFSRANAASDQLVGSLDEVALYNTALSADAIATIYAAGAYGSSTPPAVAKNPVDATIVVGKPVTLSASFSGSLPLSYQWKKDGVAVPGATSATLSLPSVYFTDAGSYVLSATNSAGQTNSAAAHLTVLATPTFANQTNALVLHLRFDGDYKDTSGHTNDATAPNGNPGFLAGEVGQAVHIATTPNNNYLVVTDPSGDLTFDEAASFTVSFWVRYTNRFNDVPIIGNAVNSTYQLGWVYTDEGGKAEWSLVSTAGSGTYVKDPVPNSPIIGDGAWHNVIGVVDRLQQVATAYIDGNLATSFSIVGLGTLNYGNAITIGQDPTGGYGTATFDLDDVGIWRRALTATDAASVYGAAQNSGVSFDTTGPVKLSVQQQGGIIDLSWQAGTLQQATNVNGPYTAVAGASAPFYRAPMDAASKFYRVQQ